MTERQIKLDASKISRSPSEAVKGGAEASTNSAIPKKQNSELLCLSNRHKKRDEKREPPEGGEGEKNRSRSYPKAS